MKVHHDGDAEMKAILLILYFGLGLVQFLAIIAGFQQFSLPWIVATLLAFCLSGIPAVGSAIGVWGAVYGWHLELWKAFLLFFGPLSFFALAGGGSAIASYFASRVSRQTA